MSLSLLNNFLNLAFAFYRSDKKRSEIFVGAMKYFFFERIETIVQLIKHSLVLIQRSVRRLLWIHVVSFQMDTAGSSQPGFEASTVAAMVAKELVSRAIDTIKALKLSSL